MKHKRDRYPGFQIGTSLLLVVLTTLCLLVFAVLSLSAALRDYKYSEKIAAKTQNYYEANSQAYEELKFLVENSKIGTHSFEIPMNEERLLAVTVNITTNSYEILEWKEVSSTTWENNDTLPVLGSDQEE